MTVSTGACGSNAMAESINGGDIQKKQEEELAALGWVDRYNNLWLPERLGQIAILYISGQPVSQFPEHDR